MSSFYEEIYKLKDTERRGWQRLLNMEYNSEYKGKFRLESVAEHCFSMLMLALELMNKNHLKLDQLKVLKMIIYHELGEIDAGDITIHDNVDKKTKYNLEKACIERLVENYKIPEALNLWLEFEKRESAEAKFVRMIDKVDPILQSEVYENKFKNLKFKQEFLASSNNYYTDFKKYKK